MPISTDLSVKPDVTGFFDPATNTISYVVKDPGSAACAVIDSVMDIDYAAGRITYDHADQIIAHIKANGLVLEWLIETHVHADHLSGAPYIQKALGGKIGIGRGITVVQDTFGKVFNEGTEFQRDGSQFDRLFSDGDTYQVGGMTGVAMHTPGHTPACMTHVMGDAAFVGDTLFMPDGGSARAERGEPVSRILSTPDRDPGLDDHSSANRVTTAVKLPTRASRALASLRAVSVSRPAPARGPYSALLRVGLAVPVLLPVPRWALTPPFHPYLCEQRRSLLCGAFPGVAPAGRYPAPLLHGSPDFPRASRTARRGRPCGRAPCPNAQ
jgi:glyoxylase-like metal-dependent hydrolase (beta-lactamase superfamily II)